MRLRHWVGSGIFCVSLIAFPAIIDAAEEIQQGQPAPRAGALIDAEKVPALVEALREARRSVEQMTVLQETIMAQQAQIATLLAQVAALESANARLDAAVKLAEEIEVLRQKQRDVATLVFDRYDRALKQADVALDKAGARINALEQRAFWSQLLSIVGPLALLVLLMF